MLPRKTPGRGVAPPASCCEGACKVPQKHRFSQFLSTAARKSGIRGSHLPVASMGRIRGSHLPVAHAGTAAPAGRAPDCACELHPQTARPDHARRPHRQVTQHLQVCAVRRNGANVSCFSPHRVSCFSPCRLLPAPSAQCPHHAARKTRPCQARASRPPPRPPPCARKRGRSPTWPTAARWGTPWRA